MVKKQPVIKRTTKVYRKYILTLALETSLFAISSVRMFRSVVLGSYFVRYSYKGYKVFINSTIVEKKFGMTKTF